MTFWPLRPGLHVIFIDILGSLFLAAWRTWRAAWRLRTGYTPCKWIYNHSIPWSTIVYHGCRGYKPTYGLHFMVFFNGFLLILWMLYWSTSQKHPPFVNPGSTYGIVAGSFRMAYFCLKTSWFQKARYLRNPAAECPQVGWMTIEL